MDIAGGIVVFVIIWWVVLFAVLPLGVRRIQNPEAGHADGAPENPQLVRKFLITTGVAVVLWLIVFAVIEADILTLRGPAY